MDKLNLRDWYKGDNPKPYSWHRGILFTSFVQFASNTHQTHIIHTSNIKTLRFLANHFFSVQLLSVLHGQSVFSFPPQQLMTSDFERIFYPRFYPLNWFSYLNYWERASIFLIECSVLNKGITGIIFITSLVWRGSWLGIKPGTSRTRGQHYTTRLSRRRFPHIYDTVRAFLYINFHS